MILTQDLGDATTHIIPLRWSGRPFVPGTAWSLVFTVKLSADLPDSARLFQKAYPAQGITVSSSTASVSVLRADTFREAGFPTVGSPAFEAAAGEYVWDIQANEISGAFRTRTVARGTLTLGRDITRLSQPTAPVFTVANPLTVMKGINVTGSETPPPSPVEDDLWHDESDNSLSIWDAVESAWITLTGPARPPETTASILDKIKGAVASPTKIGEEYLPPDWYAATVVAAAPGEFQTSTVPTPAWWDHVVVCAYNVDLPFDASEYEGKKFMLRTEAEITIQNAYSNGSPLAIIPAPSVALGVTHTLIESIGGIWMATLNYSGVSSGGGSTNYAALTDAATVALPAINTPLANALAGKAPLESPNFTTPALGVATATTINGVTIIPKGNVIVNLADSSSFVTGGNFSTGGDFSTTGGAAVTLAMPNSGARTYTFPATSGTVAFLDGDQTFVGNQIIGGTLRVTAGITASIYQSLTFFSLDFRTSAGVSMLRIGASNGGVAMGVGSVASHSLSFASGDSTTASGIAAHAEGTLSTASGNYSHASGRRAKATHQGSRVLSDSQDADVNSTTTDELTFRFANGYRFLGGSATFSGAVIASPLEVVSASVNNKFRIQNATTGANAGVVEFAFLNSGSGSNNFAFRGANCRLSVENSNDGPTSTGSFISSFATFQLGMGGYNVFGMTLAGKVGSLVPSLGSSPTWRNVLDDGSGLATLTRVSVTGNTTLAATTETVVALGVVGATPTLAITAGTMITATLTASALSAFAMPAVGAGKKFTLLLKQAVTTGLGTATFGATKWAGGMTPTITPTAGRMDILTFVSDGTNWYGTVDANFTP